jgi:uncharacterized protein (DUF983 family)
MSRQQTQQTRKKGILLRCPHEICKGRIWNYRGNMKVYAICPDCRGTVLIAKNKVEDSETS